MNLPYKKKSGFIRVFFWRLAAATALFLVFPAIGISADDYASWPYLQKIFINTSAGGARVASTQYNFPLLIRLNPGNFKSFSQTRPNGADIRFANRWGAHLPYQIEYWKDNAGDNDSAVIWVKLDTVRGKSWSNYIAMYWGNTSAVDSSNGAAVFETVNGFVGVWHLGETGNSNADGYKDATGNMAHAQGANFSAGNETAAAIGRGQAFASASSRSITVKAASEPNFDITSAITVSAWINLTSWTTAWQAILTKGDYAWRLHRNNANNTLHFVCNGLTTNYNISGSTVINSGTPYYVTGVYDGSYLRLYLNGTSDAAGLPATGSIAINDFNVMIGENAEQTGRYFNGIIDEARIERVGRSADWIRLCYQTQKPNCDSIVDVENYANWPYSQKITVNTSQSGANVPGNVYNFPLLVRLNPSNFKGFANTLANGADIRFASSSGLHLPYQIERWSDMTGNLDTAVIWVLLDVVLGNNSSQTFTIYWGKSDAASRSRGPAVFDTSNGFQGAWHLSESSGNVNDATASNHSGTRNGNQAQVAGVIGFAQTYDGTGDYSDMGNYLNPGSSNLTVSAWVKRGSTGLQNIIGKGNGGNPSASYGWIFTFDPGDLLHVYVASGGAAWGDAGTFHVASSSAMTDLAAWHHVVGVIDKSANANCKIYIDGANKTAGPQGNITGVGTVTNTANLRLCSESDGELPLHGSVDEVRVEFAARSADWIKLCYETQKPGAGIVILATAPVITLEPLDDTVLVNSPVTFAADASGSEPITFAWYKGAVGSGTQVGSSKSFTITSAKVSDSGTTYYCSATNDYGSMNSRAAFLRVLNPVPVIDSIHPLDTQVLANTAATIITDVAPFPAGVTGVTIQYAWYWSSASTGLGSVVSNQTAKSLYLPSVQLSDSGYYRCVATTAYGSDTSSAVHLRVARNWQISNPVILARNVPGEFIDSSHVKLRISKYLSLPLTPPPLFPWHADTVIVWYKANGWPADAHRTDSTLKFSLQQLQIKTADQYDTVVAVPVPPDRPVGCYRYYFRASVNWHNTGTNKDSLPPFVDTAAGMFINMCDTTPLANPLTFAFRYLQPSDSVVVTLSGLANAAVRWDLISALAVSYLIEGSTTPVDTEFSKAQLQAGANTFSFTARDQRFAGLEKSVIWQAVFKGIYANRSDTATDSMKTGVPRPQNPVVLKVSSVGATRIGLSWKPVPGGADSIRIWSGQVRVPLQYDITSGLLTSTLLPGTDTVVAIIGLSQNTTYYFGLQIKRTGLWSYVTDSSSASATTQIQLDTLPIPNKLVLQSLSFDTATNRVRFDWTIDTAGFQLQAGVVWMADSGDFTQPPTTVPLFGRIVVIFDPSKPMTWYLDVDGLDPQFDKDYWFGIWLSTIDGSWSKPVPASIGKLHIPKPTWISVAFFKNADTVYGFGNRVVLRRLPGSQLYVEGKLRQETLPVDGSGCIPVSQAFNIETRFVPPPEPYYLGIRYDSLPQGFNLSDVRMYRYDAARGAWLVDTNTTQIDQVNQVISVKTLASDNKFPYVLMIDTTRPQITVLGDDTSAVDPGNDILQQIRILDNIANVRSALRCGPGYDDLSYRKDTLAQRRDDTLTWRIPGDNVVGSCGTRILVIVSDYRFCDTLNISRDVRVTNSDDLVPEKEAWAPLGATAVLDNPAVGAALDEFAVNKVFTYDDKTLRLFRWDPNSGNAGLPFKWVEYSDAAKETFTFLPGRLIWLKTRQTSVINLGNGRTVSLRQPYSITLPANNWTDFCLPYRFNIRIGDVLAQADSAAAASLQFYVWKKDEKGRFVTSQFFLPMNAPYNDKKIELAYMKDGRKAAYSVLNPSGQDIELKIPGMPVVLSAISKAAAKKSADGWSLAVRSRTPESGELSPVFCAYVAGGTGYLAYPLPPSWSNVSVGIYDAGRKQVYGNVIARELVNGGYAYELVFENDEGFATTVSYRIDRLAGGENTEIALLDPEEPESSNNNPGPAGVDLSVTVDAHSREYRWLAVGSRGYVESFGGRLARGEFSLVRITPNPLRGALRIEYRIPYGGIEAVRCDMLDQLGRVVWSTKTGKTVHPGRNEIVWNPRGRKLASGAYIIRLTGFDGRGKVTGQKLARVMYLP